MTGQRQARRHRLRRAQTRNREDAHSFPFGRSRLPAVVAQPEIRLRLPLHQRLREHSTGKLREPPRKMYDPHGKYRTLR